jgi:molybdopterin/thiamine biosynthesis adenylyltransferase/rhodanese-related sulfurtransferase
VPLSADERARYSRHLLLPEVGVDGQERLRAGSVLVIGAGGLGSPALLYLAAAGVGRIGIADFDRVDVTNLQRQIVHGTPAVGTSKARSAAARLRELNPHVEVVLHEAPVDVHNVLALVGAYDVVVDGTDNFPTRYLVNDACVLVGRPYVYGSILRFEGQASVFAWRGGPDYRDLFPVPPAPGTVPSCGEAGVLGVLPGIIGTIQATEALKLLLGLGTSLSGRVLLYDALDLRFTEITLRRDPARPQVTALVPIPDGCGVDGLERVAPDAFAARRRSGWSPVVVDVRSPAEWSTGVLPGTAHLVPHDDVEALATAVAGRPAFLVCRSGRRSEVAARALLERGATAVAHLEGGLLGWDEARHGSLVPPPPG